MKMNLPLHRTPDTLMGHASTQTSTPQDTDSPVINRRKKKSAPIDIYDEYEEALVEWLTWS